MEFENILTLIKTVSDSELTGFKYEENGVKISLTKKGNETYPEVTYAVPQEVRKVEAVAEVKGTKEAVSDNEEELTGNIIKSPLVGTFYSAPAEDAENFVALGDTVKKGQTLAIIEAMKLMNEIESEYNGKIVEIFVENGQAVEYGQPLFRVE